MPADLLELNKKSHNIKKFQIELEWRNQSGHLAFFEAVCQK